MAKTKSAGSLGQDLIKSWRDAIVFDINLRLSYVLSNSTDSISSSYLKKFNLKLIDIEDPYSNEEMERIWEAGLLELIVGSPIFDGSAVNMNLVVYIGSLQGKLPHNQFPLQQTVDASTVRSASEGIALVTLFALSENAIALRKAPHITCRLLAQADSLISDLAARDTSRVVTSGDIRQIAVIFAAPVKTRLGEQACAAP